MTDSDNVEIKKRSRRRLVGAAALALLAAIILPMVMDQEPGSPAQDIQVTIPDREADSTLSRPIASRSTQTADAHLAPPPEELAPANVPSDVQRPAPPVTVPAAPPRPQQAGQSAAQIPHAVTAETVTDAARAQAILEGKSAAPVPGAPGESFVVQIGAFGDGNKAASIAADLKKRGIAAYTEKAGAVTRVRVGPFRGRDEAEKAAQRVRASGLNGSVMPR